VFHAPCAFLFLCFMFFMHHYFFSCSCVSLLPCFVVLMFCHSCVSLLLHVLSTSLLLSFTTLVFRCSCVLQCNVLFCYSFICFAPLLCMKPSTKYLFVPCCFTTPLCFATQLPKLILAPPPLFFKFSDLGQGAWGVGTTRLQV
jgi:hypothetical protein